MIPANFSLNASSVDAGMVKVDIPLVLIASWPNTLLISTLTQLRAAAWLLAEFVSSGSQWARQETTVYHVLSEDVYVVIWRMGSQVIHSGYINLQQVTNMDWLPFVSDVADWAAVPTWVKVKLSQQQPAAG